MNATPRTVAIAALAFAILLAACSSTSKPHDGTTTGATTQPNGATTSSGAAADGPQATPGLAITADASPAAADRLPDANETSGTPPYTFSSPEPPAPFTPAAPPPTRPVAGATAAPPAPSPAITIGAASVVPGAVHVPVGVVGFGLAPFTAFSVHLRWDPAVFNFASANNAGTILPGSSFCPPIQMDSDGNGAIYSCTAIGGNQTTSAGLLATFVLAPVGTGCSALHLFTYEGGDGGDGSTGTFTMDADTKVQLTVTIDGRVDQAGQVC